MELPIWGRQVRLFEETPMAKTPGRPTRPGFRPGKAPVTAGAPATVTIDAPAPRKKTSIPQFFSQVRAEARKIVWPSRKETWITSVMVAIMVVMASIFFLGVDWIINFSLNLFLQFANRG